jgi:hypothetical protein
MSCEVHYSIESSVEREAAWNFWSNGSNWATVDPGVDSVDLDGPFITGAQGVTRIPELTALHWHLTEVESGRKAFEDAAHGGVQITQRVTLCTKSPFWSSGSAATLAVSPRLSEPSYILIELCLKRWNSLGVA